MVGVKLKRNAEFLASGVEKKGYSNFGGKKFKREKDCRLVPLFSS